MTTQDSSHTAPPGIASRLALLAIRGYQRWLSPIKGFRCAHAVHHGGPGCSGYAMQAISEHGLFGALGAIRRRFRACQAALGVLKSEQAGDTEGSAEGDGETAKAPKNGVSWCDLSVVCCAFCGGSQ